MNNRIWILPLATLLLACGCASNGVNDAQTRQAQAATVQAEADKVQANQPLTAATRFAAGQLAEGQGDLDDAVLQYQAALKIDPHHVPSLYRLALLQADMKHFPQALELWQRYVTDTHGSAAAYSNLGFCYELANQPQQAEAAYQAGIAADPKNQPCRVNYGLLLAKRGQLDAAQQQLAAVLSPADVHYDLASVLQSQGQMARARAEYQQALKLDPNLTDAKARLATIQ